MLRRLKRQRRLPLKLREDTASNERSHVSRPSPYRFKAVRVGRSFRAQVTPRKAKNAFNAAKKLSRSSSSCKYPVLRILKHSVTNDAETKFTLLWAPPDEEETMEPIENIHESPLMVKKYILREEIKFRRRLRSSGVNSGTPFQFPRMKTSISNKLNHPAESYIPIGCEKIEKILEEIDVGRGIKLWLVKFIGMEDAHFVNRQRIIYYFPLHACLYVHECQVFLKKK